MFTQRHYNAIAEMIHRSAVEVSLRHMPHDAEHDCIVALDAINTVRREMCELFAADNARFDKARFMLASGGAAFVETTH